MTEADKAALAAAWADRAALWVKGTQLVHEGTALRAQASKATPENRPGLLARADKLWTEGNDLTLQASRVWSAAVAKAGGPPLEWKQQQGRLACTLGAGEERLTFIEPQRA